MYQDNHSQKITLDQLRELSEPVKQLIGRGMIVAVQQDTYGQRRYAKFSMNRDRLLLHHLSEGSPPPEAYVLEFHDVLRLVDPSSRVTFLELGSPAGATLGHLIIRITPDTKGGQNFALLCSGEKGPSYANTRLFQVHHRGNRWEYVGGGDYEYNNGEGGQAVVQGLELGPEYVRPWVPGIVRGFWGLGSTVGGQFFIGTREHPGGECSPAFGMVEEGLDVLRDAVRFYLNITDVSVKDCGIVLT